MKAEDVVAKIKATKNVVEVANAQLGVAYRRWIVEGDLPLAEHELLTYAIDRVAIAAAAQADPKATKRGLVAIEKNGKILRWAPGKTLDYCVWKPSFAGNDAEYAAVVKDMKFATEDWSAICGVRFEYRADQDTNADLKMGDVLMPVLRHSGGGNTLAMSFFPDSPVSERVLWVFDGHFGDSGFDKVGILRHELGHVLGFRHEHILPEAPDFFGAEPTDHIVKTTAYDPKSVMHYVGPGVGDPALAFTELDKLGSKRVYGHPDTDFEYQVE